MTEMTAFIGPTSQRAGRGYETTGQLKSVASSRGGMERAGTGEISGHFAS